MWIVWIHPSKNVITIGQFGVLCIPINWLEYRRSFDLWLFDHIIFCLNLTLEKMTGGFKDDFQSVLCSLRTVMFKNIINSAESMLFVKNHIPYL